MVHLIFTIACFCFCVPLWVYLVGLFLNGCWLFGLLCLNFKLTQSFSSISGKYLCVFLGGKIQFPLALFGTLTKGFCNCLLVLFSELCNLVIFISFL